MTDIQVDPARLKRALKKKLSNGSHTTWGEGACIMEAVAYVAREAYSDHPECASPVIGVFMRFWNDALNDDDRNRLLKPYIVKLVGTRGSAELENRRATMAADWFIRVQTPAWLRLAGLSAEAEALASFPEITDFAKTPSIMEPLKAAQKNAAAARAGARAAAWDAAWDVARDAARAAAGAAAWAAVRAAAWDAAWDVAGAGARAAAWDAAWDAAGVAAGAGAGAGAKLAPTVAELQASALGLLDRMIEAKDPA